jgi:molybdenum cofactor biosynthesis protein B
MRIGIGGKRRKCVPGIDESRTFVPVRIAILTVTDTRTRATDTSGDLLVQRLESAGHVLADRALIRDDVDHIRETIRNWADDPRVDVVISTGGTGLTGRDVTVEAVTPLFDKVIDGFSVIFHQVSYKSVGLSTIQSRACAGLVGGTFVFCLPGSTGACRDGWDEVISLQLDSRHRPCNLVEIMPRLAE